VQTNKSNLAAFYLCICRRLMVHITRAIE